MAILDHARLVDVIRTVASKLRCRPEKNSMEDIAYALNILADELEDAFIRKVKK